MRGALDPGARGAHEVIRRAEQAGVDLPALTARLEREGVRSFCASYRELLACIEAKVAGKDRRRADAYTT